MEELSLTQSFKEILYCVILHATFVNDTEYPAQRP